MSSEIMKNVQPDEDLIPRDYQVELMNRAINENTIIYLPTGSGKTFIALLILKRMAGALDKSDGKGKVSVILVNTVALVDQHCNNLKRHTPFDVGAYTGDMKVDFWIKQKWVEEFNKHQIFVMTAQIFLNVIMSSFLNMNQFNLIIFDECHHGVEDQVMRQIMKFFQNVVDQPRVVGLTATLLNKNCIIQNVMSEIKELEVTYQSRIATASDLNKVFDYSTNPNENLISYKKYVLCPFEERIVFMLEELIATLGMVKLDEPKQPYSDRTELDLNSRPKSLINNLKDIIIAMNTFGIFGSSLTFKCFIIFFQQLRCHTSNEILFICLNAMITSCLTFKNKVENALQDTKDTLYPFSSPKLKALFKILKLEKNTKENFLGIIFVERRATAKILYQILVHLKETNPDYNFLVPNFVVGVGSNPHNITRGTLYASKVHRRILDTFTNGDINLLIATSVIEEGVDVPKCSFVCKFDPPLNYRSYVQSKGRARSKTSNYYIMIEDAEMEKFTVSYNNFREVEKFLTENLSKTIDGREKPTDSELGEMYSEDEILPYYVNNDPKSACITMVSAISLLCRYCQSLPSDLYTLQQPKWFLANTDDKICKIIIELPIVCPLIDPIAASSISKRNAKRKAAFVACKLLHNMGELDDNLLPKDRTILENVDHLFTHWLKDDNLTKRRSYEKQFASYTKGIITVNEPVYIHVIRIESKFPNDDTTMATMKLLYDSDLTYGIISVKEYPKLCDFPIYVTQGEIMVSLHVNYKRTSLNQKQLDGIKKFNMLIFSELLDILNTFLLIDMNNENNKLFCVPLNKNNDYDIDFNIIDENESLVPLVEPTNTQKREIIVNNEAYLHKIVTPWYRNDKVDYVVKEVTNLTAESDFPSDTIETYSQYFDIKYNQTILNKSNPLILVKALSSRLNCIKPRGSTNKKKRKDLYLMETEDIHLIPELCVKQEFPASLWAKALILPTILERIYKMLLVEDLRIKINTEINIPNDNGRNWKPLIMYCKEHYEEKGPTTTPLVMNIGPTEEVEIIKTSTTKLNKEFKSKMLERQYPWTDMEEPIDIERKLDVTVLDIEGYVNFVSVKLTSPQTELRNNVQHNTLAIEYNMNYVHKDIKSICNDNDVSPELRELFEAICTAKANDVVNLERYETLGDSFLKLIVSLYVYLKYPEYDEGKATILKSKLVSNKNLYYHGIRKNLCGILKASDFEPKSQWIPPGFTIPSCVKTAYNKGKFLANYIYKVYLTPEEQVCGKLKNDTMNYIFSDKFFNDDDDVGGEQSSLYFFDRQEVADKTVADIVEALLGVYYKNCGLKGATKLLQWFEIVPKSECLEDLMKMKPLSPILKKDVNDSSICFLLPSWKQLESKLGYTFKNRGYLLQALTHASYSPNRITRSYEMLEFIGDAVLDFLITCFIFETCGNLTPGELTDLRSALVNNITFACYTVRCEFHKFLLLLNTDLEKDIDKFVQYQENNGFAVTDNVLILLTEDDINMAENVDCPKVLGDIFEALVGAVYLDSGFDLQLVWRVFYKIMWKEIDMFSKDVPKNVVRLLHEKTGAHPDFSEPIPVNKVMMIKLDFMMNGSRKRVYGFGNNKKNAKKAAAKMALRVMNT